MDRFLVANEYVDYGAGNIQAAASDLFLGDMDDADKARVAFGCRPGFDEYFWDGIHAEPHLATMRALEESRCLQDLMEKLPDDIGI